MHIKSFRAENFRRLKNVQVDLESDRTIFVGANNSGKTSATHLFQLFLGKSSRGAFQIYDFTADCWDKFNSLDFSSDASASKLPQITFDIWLDVDDDNLHRVIDLLPSLDWSGEPVGVRMVYAPRDPKSLVANYLEARDKAHANTSGPSSYKPWPRTMVEYLTRRLQQEYEIHYFSLDAKQCATDLTPLEGYTPFLLGTQSSGDVKSLESIIAVDFLHAQRHLADIDSRGRSEDLSKRLSRFYARNLQQFDDDLDALGAIADSEERLNAHFARVFGPTLNRLGEVGYPGIGNPGLVVKASFDAHNILSTSARVHYSLPQDGDGKLQQMLPDQYNGLGFKNLIYMVIEMLDFDQAWAQVEESRAPIHLVFIEEPEAHLHAQLQQVFIRKIQEILPAQPPGFQTQLVVTTHSPHIIYESNFKPIRYFCRSISEQGPHVSEVKNLSSFYANEEEATRDFLQQYIKLTHCDLFFADGAVLVEGNVERILLPLIIERFVPKLVSRNLTILEVGGAFAHRFEKLLEFLGLPTLVITDLDSVNPPINAEVDDTEEDTAVSEVDGVDADADADADEEPRTGSACPVHTPGAVTSNQTLLQWIPSIGSIEALLDAGPDLKSPSRADGSPGLIAVAYQTYSTVKWREESHRRAGRTLEEAFTLQNLDWTQSAARKHLGLRIPRSADLSMEEMHSKIYARVRSFDKTQFALGLISDLEPTWVAPDYIVEGLEWLTEKLDLLTSHATNEDPTEMVTEI